MSNIIPYHAYPKIVPKQPTGDRVPTGFNSEALRPLNLKEASEEDIRKIREDILEVLEGISYGIYAGSKRFEELARIISQMAETSPTPETSMSLLIPMLKFMWTPEFANLKIDPSARISLAQQTIDALERSLNATELLKLHGIDNKSIFLIQLWAETLGISVTEAQQLEFRNFGDPRIHERFKLYLSDSPANPHVDTAREATYPDHLRGASYSMNLKRWERDLASVGGIYRCKVPIPTLPRLLEGFFKSIFEEVQRGRLLIYSFVLPNVNNTPQESLAPAGILGGSAEGNPYETSGPIICEFLIAPGQTPKDPTPKDSIRTLAEIAEGYVLNVPDIPEGHWVRVSRKGGEEPLPMFVCSGIPGTKDDLYPDELDTLGYSPKTNYALHNGDTTHLL